jgi:hypothetical protein
MLNSLAGLAWVAGTRGQLDRAALLPGAGAALSQELGISLVPHAQVHEDACETAAPAGLGEDRYPDTCPEASRCRASRGSPRRWRTRPRPAEPHRGAP